MRPMIWRMTEPMTCFTLAMPRFADCCTMKPGPDCLSGSMKYVSSPQFVNSTTRSASAPRCSVASGASSTVVSTESVLFRSAAEWWKRRYGSDDDTGGLGGRFAGPRVLGGGARFDGVAMLDMIRGGRACGAPVRAYRVGRGIRCTRDARLDRDHGLAPRSAWPRTPGDRARRRSGTVRRSGRSDIIRKRFRRATDRRTSLAPCLLQ